jgi:acetyl esterase/lipase
MHLTVPATGGPHPVMFWVHGGAWRGGTLEHSEVHPGNQAAYLADHLGVAVASVAYRCKGSMGTFTQALEDVMDAIQYVRDHADKFGISTRRIGLYGGSAGTPLSALAAQRTPEADLYIGYNGIYDFVPLARAGWGKHDDYGLAVPSAEANSAICQLKPNPPHTLLLHGTVDQAVSPQQSVNYVQAIQKAGGHAQLLMYKGEGHAFFNAGRPMEIPTLYEVKEFIKRVWEIRP